MELIFEYFSGFWGKIELAGTIASIICVYLATKHNQWTWFFGAIGVILFGVLFYHYKLYSDAGLQILFFLPMQVYGFIVWQRMAHDANDFLVTKSFPNEEIGDVFLWPFLVVIIFALSMVNGVVMDTYTDAALPYVDALTTWLSIFAQVLMIRKFWESWILWIVMDVIAIGVYTSRELYVVAGLYVIFLVMATMGLIKWRKNWNEQKVA